MAKGKANPSTVLNSITGGGSSTFSRGMRAGGANKLMAGRIDSKEAAIKVWELEQQQKQMAENLNKGETPQGEEIIDKVKASSASAFSPFSIENVTFTVVHTGDDRKSGLL